MKKIFCATLLSAAMLMPFVASADTQVYAPIDPIGSRLSAEKTSLTADGIDNALITVTVRDVNLIAIPGKKVVVTSSRGSADEIRVQSDVTDLLGKAYFRIFSLRNGTATFSASANGVALQRVATVNFVNGLSFALSDGDLIKIPDDGNVQTLSDTAVYYYAVNGKRYVFPNEKVFYTWYPDFSKVKILPIDQMSLIPIGGNVTYHPGSKLVKFQTDPKTYIVTRGGVLRWAKTEEVVRGWFGPNWNQMVDDISEAFYVNYTFGQPVANSLDLALDIVRSTASNIDNDKRLQ